MKRESTKMLNIYIDEYMAFTESALISNFKHEYGLEFDGWFKIIIETGRSGKRIDSLFITHTEGFGSGTFFFLEESKRWIGTVANSFGEYENELIEKTLNELEE